MALSLANALTEVRDLLNEATAVFWSDAQITKWIQEGTRIFSSKTLMVEDTQVITPLVANQLSYSSSDETWIADVLEIYSAIYYSGTAPTYKGLVKIHPRQIGNLALGTAGPIKYYTFHDRKIYLWPVPNATIIAAGANITFLFSKETDDITALTDEFQHLPIIYAVAKAKQKDMKFGEATALLSQFFQELSFERTDKYTREVDSLDKFKIPATGGGNQSAAG
jgi:hypothetical protein